MESIYEAIKILKQGGLILYPTDTIWGIGCDATNPEAVAKVYKLKQRVDSKALVLLASDLDMVAKYIKEIPPMAIDLVEVNDAPMTIIYPGVIGFNSNSIYSSTHEAKSSSTEASTNIDTRIVSNTGTRIAPNAVAEDGSVGIRIPIVGSCKELVRRFGRPIVSTSANISGQPSPANFEQIAQAIKDGVDFIVDPSLEKECSGKASQIIKVGLDYEIKIIRA